MKLKTRLAIISFALAAAAAASAQDGPPPMMMDGPHGMHGGPGMPGPMGHGGPHLPGVTLTDAQQDKIFAIVHAAEPAHREHGKALHKAHEDLRVLASSGQFDEARAASLAKAIGDAQAALALEQARVEAQIAAVLTPEQREQVRKSAPHGRS